MMRRATGPVGDTAAAVGPIAYLTGEYPAPPTRSFNVRLPLCGRSESQAMTFTIRRTSSSHHVGPEQKAEAVRTFCVQSAALRPIALLRAHAMAVQRAPLRYLHASVLHFSVAHPVRRASFISFSISRRLAYSQMSCIAQKCDTSTTTSETPAAR